MHAFCQEGHNFEIWLLDFDKDRILNRDFRYKAYSYILDLP